MTNASTALKAQAANAWCKSASRVKVPPYINQPQKWEHILLKQSVSMANEGSSFNALLPLMRQETVMLVAGLYGELGLEV